MYEIVGMDEIIGSKNPTPGKKRPIVSPIDPERKWTAKRRDHTGKPKPNRVEQISILARSVTE
jgi:hypothetical protein